MSTVDLKSLSRVERISKLFDWSPFDYQAELIRHGDETDVVEAAVKPGRQVGKTETGGAIAAERALSGHDVMVLGPFEDTVKEMMSAAKGHLLRCEEKFAEAGFELGDTKRNTLDWKFANGGRLRARTVGSDGTQVRGKNPDVVIVDEAAYIKESIYEEVIEAFFSTHQEYEYYLFSTPAGKDGFFYRKVELDDAWYSPHWPSSISPLISDEWLEERRQKFDHLTFAQEFLGEFVEEGNSYLPHSLVNPCVTDGITDNPTQEKWLGVDVARKGADRTVYYGLDDNGDTFLLESEETSTMPGVVGRIKHLHETHDFTKILIDENAVGGGVVDFSQEGLGDVIKPVTFTSKSKQSMYTALKTAFEEKDITIPKHRRLINQLTSMQFEFTQTGILKVSHPDGGHDDYPDALALAQYGRVDGHQPQTYSFNLS